MTEQRTAASEQRFIVLNGTRYVPAEDLDLLREIAEAALVNQQARDGVETGRCTSEYLAETGDALADALDRWVMT